MSTPYVKSLPSRPNLGYLKKRAKRLLRDYLAGDDEALQWVAAVFPNYAAVPDHQSAASQFFLHDAQLVLARQYGFASWPQLKHHVQAQEHAIGRSDRRLSPLSEGFLAASAGANESPKSQKLRVLVVDDDDGVRDYLEALFSRQGHDVFAAASGEEALEMLETAHPDIVTLDIVMPGMDGLETLVRIRDARPDLPVIMLSGHGQSRNIVRAMRLGAHNFLRKPFEVEEMELAFDQALGGDWRR